MSDLILYSARAEVIAVLAPSLFLSLRTLPPPSTLLHPHTVPAGSLSDGTSQFILLAKQEGDKNRNNQRAARPASVHLAASCLRFPLIIISSSISERHLQRASEPF